MYKVGAKLAKEMDGYSNERELLNEWLVVLKFALLITVFDLSGFYFVRGLGLHMPGYRGLFLVPLLMAVKFRSKLNLSTTITTSLSGIIVLSLSPIIGFGVGPLPFITLVVPAMILDATWPLIDTFKSSILKRVMAVILATIAYTGTVPFLLFSNELGLGHYLLKHFSLINITTMYSLFGFVGGIVGLLFHRS